MSDANKCPQCGTPLKSPALGGLCPACLLAQGANDTVTDAKQPPFDPPSVAELAALFPQLEVLELIGKGGMGAVYKARQKELDRIVALKILPPGIGETAGFAERFTREAKALAKLNHPNIVTLYEFGRADGLFFFLMEFVDGVNLRQLLAGERISPHEALAIVPQICDALQFAHDHGIVHRDIKPENILMDRRGRVKVADFGVAKLVGKENEISSAQNADSSSLTDAGKTLGTPQYMAPEQKERPLEVDHRADIYALGVVFYQMLTGELPGKRIEPPSKKVHIDVRLDEVVLRALEKKPEMRYQQASVFKTEVETIAEDSSSGTDFNKSSEAKFPAPPHWFGYEYKSKRTWFGLPLLHVATGIDPRTGKARKARGIVALGGIATGWLAIGGRAYGGIAFGGIAVGGVAFGGLAAGVVSFGGLTLALVLALGAMAIAPIALGGWAMGYFVIGGQTVGPLVFDSEQHNPETLRQFYRSKQPLLFAVMAGVWFTSLALYFFITSWAKQRILKQTSAANNDPAKTRPALSIKRMLNIPSLGLIILSSLSLLVLAVAIPLWVYGAVLSIAGKTANVPWPIVLPVMLTMAGFNIVSLIGALRMRQLRSYTLAVVGSILFMLTPGLGLVAANACKISPTTASTVPGFVLAFLFGIWALVVLNRKEVREAFSTPPPTDNLLTREIVSQKTGRRWIQMVLFASAIFFFAIGIWKITQLDLQPHELFFGVLLVCILSFCAVALGFLARPSSLDSTAPASNPPSRIMDIFLPDLNPPEKRIRVAVVTILLMAIAGFGIQRCLKSDASSHSKHSPTAESASLTFGPVIEQVVTDAIDFDSGKLIDLPLPHPLGDRDAARYEWINSKESSAWKRQYGIDAVNGNHALMSVNLQLLKLDEKDWNKISADELLRRILAQNAADTFESTYKTFGFKTIEGGMGILQIMGDRFVAGTATREPGVKIRYKLLRGAPASSQTEDAKVLKPIPTEASTAIGEWAALFKSKTVREMTDPSVQAEMRVLQKRFKDLLTGTAGQPVWERLEQVSKEAQRAYSQGNDEDFRRLIDEKNKLGAELMALVEKSGKQNGVLVFGPVVERVLPDPDNGSGKANRETLILRTGERISTLDDAPKEQGGRLRALVASQGDLFVEYDDFVGKRWAFTTAGLKLSDFLNRQWDTATAADVNEALKVPTALQNVEHSGATLYLLPEGLLPMTFAFETRTAQRGLLQVTALNDNPRMVTVRYKLLQQDARASSVSENAPTSQEFALSNSSWFLAGNNPHDYKTSTDATMTHSGKPSAHLQSIVPDPRGFATLMQSFKANSFRGQRIRMTGFVRSEKVMNSAALWMRVDGKKGETLAFDNMGDRQIKGTADWTKYDIVLNVPKSAQEIAFGILLSGRGEIWMSAVSFEIVGNDIPTTAEDLPNAQQ